MQDDVIAVSVLGEYLKRIIDAEELLYSIKIFGEVSSFSVSAGNSYFILKDEKATLNCVCFNCFKTYIPKIGDKVIVTGSPKYYVKGGKLSFNVSKIEEFGKGDIFNQFLMLKEKLEKEGLFDIAHKKQIPEVINKIGVVTAENGAVIHDILTVATRRNKNIKIVLYPTKVQGVGASEEIVKGINFFSNSDVDAVIVGRGGGSEEDLLAYNTEEVARSAYNCSKFLVSAVGHETNYTLIDFVADLRAPTPSAAAELLVKETKDFVQEIDYFKKNFILQMQRKIEYNKQKVETLLADLSFNIKQSILKNNARLDNLILKLKQNNPINILEKGYSIVEKEGKNIDSVSLINNNDLLNVIFKDGKAVVEVKKIG